MAGKADVDRPWNATAFFVFTFGFSWGLWLPGWLITLGWLPAGILPTPLLQGLVVLGGTGPSLVALLLVARRERLSGVWTLLRRAFQFRRGRRALPAFGLLPAVVLAAHALNFGLRGVPMPRRPILAEPWWIPVLFAVFWVLQFSEEPGWRGFALERLRLRLGPVVSSLLVGGVWALWHLPMFFSRGFGQHDHGIPFTPFAVTLILVSILMTWLQERTGGSLVPAMLLHAWINTLGEVLPLYDPVTGETGAWWIANALLAILVFVGGAISPPPQAG